MNVLVPQPVLIIAQLEVTKSISVVHPVSEMGMWRCVALLSNNLARIFFLTHSMVLVGLLLLSLIPVEINSSMSPLLEHCPSSSILHVTVDQKRLLARFGFDAVESTGWPQSVKQLRAV